MEEVIQPCDILSEHVAPSDTKRSRARRSRSSSISRIQETVMPMESTKPQEQTKFEGEKIQQDIIPSESQVEEVVESCGILNQHIVTSETKKKRAKKAKDSSFSGVQETIVPMEFTGPQQQTGALKEKAIQDMIPSESQLKEVVEPYGTLSQNISSSEIKKKKAKKARDSSMPRVQETVIPME